MKGLIGEADGRVAGGFLTLYFRMSANVPEGRCRPRDVID